MKGVCEKKFFWKNFFGGVDFFGGVERGWCPPYPPPLKSDRGNSPPPINLTDNFNGRIYYLFNLKFLAMKRMYILPNGIVVTDHEGATTYDHR